MRLSGLFAASLAAGVTTVTALEVDLLISARSSEVDSDWTAVFYDVARPLLIGNDGGASTGGFHVFDLNGNGSLPEKQHETPGRTKLVTTAYGISEKDLIVTIAMPDSYFRLYDASTAELVGEPLTHTLGDWSALCTWKSQTSGEQYLYLFGKSQAVHFLLREREGSYELIEIQTFETPVEASSCAVSPSAYSVYFAGDDSPTIYTFAAAETTEVPHISTLGEAGNDVTGLATYIGRNSDYLLVAEEDIIEVFDISFNLLGSMKLTGDEDIEIQGLNVYQASTDMYPSGAVTYAIESDSGTGFGVSSSETAFEELGLVLNTAYDPRKKTCKPTSPVCSDCSFSGFCGSDATSSSCSCFAGFDGSNCAAFTCRNDCSAHGKCIGANICQCDEGWGGLYCAFKVVQPVAETEANGGDGDDPAIWVSPIDKTESRIITTTKSEEGAGFGVFDLSGGRLQTIAAGEPNNVDVIYNFQAGNRTVDLVYAACRADNTLWYV